MESFNHTHYGEGFASVLEPDRPVAIGVGDPSMDQESRLRDLTIERAFAGQNLRDANHAACCISAAWLWHDFLDQSHQISQQIETSSGSFWHAIMHRREGDYSNAKYWFRRVDGHPVYDGLASAATFVLAASEELPGDPPFDATGGWDPFQFVDLCQQAAGQTGTLHSVCQQLTRLEWQLLFDYCFHQACPGDTGR